MNNDENIGSKRAVHYGILYKKTYEKNLSN